MYIYNHDTERGLGSLGLKYFLTSRRACSRIFRIPITSQTWLCVLTPYHSRVETGKSLELSDQSAQNLKLLIQYSDFKQQWRKWWRKNIICPDMPTYTLLIYMICETHITQTHIHSCTPTRVCTHPHTHTPTHRHTHIHKHTSTHTWIHTQTHRHTHCKRERGTDTEIETERGRGRLRERQKKQLWHLHQVMIPQY